MAIIFSFPMVSARYIIFDHSPGCSYKSMPISIIHLLFCIIKHRNENMPLSCNMRNLELRIRNRPFPSLFLYRYAYIYRYHYHRTYARYFAFTSPPLKNNFVDLLSLEWSTTCCNSLSSQPFRIKIIEFIGH